MDADSILQMILQLVVLVSAFFCGVFSAYDVRNLIVAFTVLAVGSSAGVLLL